MTTIISAFLKRNPVLAWHQQRNPVQRKDIPLMNPKPLNEPTFGIVEFVHPDDAPHYVALPDDPPFKYTASRTGLILYPDHVGSPIIRRQVIANINGSTVIVPLEATVDACNFDHYVLDWLSHQLYRLPVGDELGVAYFDPISLMYTDQPTVAHLAQWPETHH